MSAAANAAGYLYAHGHLPLSRLNAQAASEGSEPGTKSQSSGRVEPKADPFQRPPQPLKRAGTPRIEYRKRRLYALPSPA